MATEVFIPEPKACDLHPDCVAAYDLRLPGGRWGNVCEATYHTLGDPPLGVGRGQRLIVGEAPERTDSDIRTEIRAAIEAGDFEAAFDAAGDRDPLEFL